MSHAKSTKRTILSPVSQGNLSPKDIRSAVSSVAQARKNRELPHFEIGDNVDVHTTVMEGGKKRIRIVTGTVIGKSGSGAQESFTVRPVGAGQTTGRQSSPGSMGTDTIEARRSDIVPHVRLGFLSDGSGRTAVAKQRSSK